eukprot:CAMPEP_0203749202 /NCGR_PEP_ID=MMETSP0098-20131031/3850_1 /ASSEMBLY_ACC=CAM_ASM_000208 /TAXON_ID=96639 /ORGANISM=" , Strain NY0313808BC1" /LENGTH=318 /DNA_ID=CAMNT_0050638191 /DNA_START=334 /DNA_END=1290 /DNA_ORIENTATION=+
MAPQCGNGPPLRVKVTEDPGSTFYKDEGGKANHLTTAIILEDFKNSKAQHIGRVVMKPRLCYENGRDVEDGPEIFTVLSMEPKSITTTDQRILVKFRIEKVSRRKDGQRFKVRFDLDEQLSTPLCREVKPAFTSPVCVLSKRKFPSLHHDGHGSLSVPQKKLSAAKRSKSSSKNMLSASMMSGARRGSHQISKSEMVTLETVMAMRRTIALLESKVSTLTDRVQFLEKENVVKKERSDSISNNSQCSSGSTCDGCDYPDPAHVSSDTINIGKFALDYEDHDMLCSIGEFTPRNGLKRVSSNDMMFNFGLPSSMEPDYY